MRNTRKYQKINADFSNQKPRKIVIPYVVIKIVFLNLNETINYVEVN